MNEINELSPSEEPEATPEVSPEWVTFLSECKEYAEESRRRLSAETESRCVMRGPKP